MKLVGTSIAALRAALQAGEITAVGLLAGYMRRIAAFDLAGPRLNALVVLNPQMFDEARASDIRRAEGRLLGPLDGIPYTAKNSYKVKGLTVAAGSPAFKDLIANDDAFAIAALRAGGAVLIGLTNMPPMANGGMQRGLYGRAESPYNPAYLTAAFASGSSNGSGSATAASFSAFGMGEETWSSGRAPAANNALCAYTPSRGVLSVRGNWPLVPTMDVVVPHSRSMADMFEILNVIAAEDHETRGDFWRAQPWVTLPDPSLARARDYHDCAPASDEAQPLAGRTFALPALYANQDPLAGTAAQPGVGGPTGQRIDSHPEMIAQLDQAVAVLRDLGATVVISDFPLVTNYEGDRPGAPKIHERGLVCAAYLKREIVDLSVWAWDDFLRANADPNLPNLAAVTDTIFPTPIGALPDRYTGFDDDINTYPAFARANPNLSLTTIPEIAEGLRGLEATRKADLEDWMALHGYDAVIFPAVADVAPATADHEPAAAEIAWRNGVWVANGNLAIRHMGVPTVTVPMGLLASRGMPAGLTFAGAGYDDLALLRDAAAFEAGFTRCHGPRPEPATTPELPLDPFDPLYKAPELGWDFVLREIGALGRFG